MSKSRVSEFVQQINSHTVAGFLFCPIELTYLLKHQPHIFKHIIAASYRLQDRLEQPEI